MSTDLTAVEGQGQALNNPPDDFDFLDLDVGPIIHLVVFSLRNGRLEDAKSLLVRPTIAKFWHWRTIRGLDPRMAIRALPAFIRMYIAQLSAAVPQAWGDERKKKTAIVLGVCRAVMTSLYDVTEEDLIVGERAEPWLEATMSTDGKLKISMLASVDAATRTALTGELTLNEGDLAAVTALHMCAIGILPLQGYSLTVCSHHYLSDPATQSRRAYLVVEKAHLTSTLVAPWFATLTDELKDAMWHKAGHPVSLTVKRRLAFSDTIPKMLAEAGAGAAASRLPAVEPEMRAANSLMTLFQTVRPLMECYGGIVDYSILTLAVNTVREFSAENPSLINPTFNTPGVPGWVNCRMEAVKWLSQLIEKNRDMSALCYGFYCALSEANALLAGASATDTLKMSYSLSKLKSQSFAAYIAGQQAHVDYAAAKNARRAKGEYVAPTVTFGE